MSKLEEMILENYSSIEEFAGICQVSYPLLETYCKGYIPFKFCSERNLQKICDALETTPAELGYEGEYITRFVEGKEVYKVVIK